MAALFAALPATSSWATDVYFYNAQSQSPQTAKTDVRRLTFSPYGVTVVFDDGRKMEYVKKQDFDYFMFRDRTATGIGTVSATGDNVRFGFDGSSLCVVSDKAIARVDVYSVNGQKIASSVGNGNEAQLWLGGSPSGVYVVRALAGGKANVRKIVKR